MPDRRQNRGAHPGDDRCFGPDALPMLRRATAELSWLLDRGYAIKASQTLVGDRYALRARQRDALGRCAQGDTTVATRQAHRVPPAALDGRAVAIDGYNVLLTVEAAMSDAVILHARDGTFRDMAAMSKHYRRVRQTRPALEAVGRWLSSHGCLRADWYLDRPVSNSGRLAGLIDDVGRAHDWPWRVELVPNPDPVLVASPELIATADGGILDRRAARDDDAETRWLNLARHVVETAVPGSWILDLS